MAGVSVEADDRAVVRESAESVGRGSVSTPGDGGVEPVRKGTQNCYKTKDKKGRQEDLFPMLQEEINRKRAVRSVGVKWPAVKRGSVEFRQELARVAATRIGGTATEQRVFFDRVIAVYPHSFWIEGCEAPTVRDKVIGFRMKPGMKPVARQPIPLSPYDDLRVEFQIEEFVADGKLRAVDTLKEQLPEWTTPVFIVDQDAKGLLGRLVCAYGPVNNALEIPSFPSADPIRAFEMAAGKSHHTVVDAIWGYTQFLIDEPTRKMLTICTRSGLYEWLRMPFGPAPAPAEMQSYVSSRFGRLKNRCGEEFVSPCMDDLKVSSETFVRHVEDCQDLLAEADKYGFEFKMEKGQFNQEEIEFWGCVLDGKGRRVQEKKVKQLEEWPEPVDAAALNSFLCFVNYLMEYMSPGWIEAELVLRPFRKKGCDFRMWYKEPKYREAFLRIRSALCREVVLLHVDYVAASRPERSGRPLEMFVDASDYGWAATLCQRPEPHAAPKIVAILAKGFSDVQQRWSAMERELYALWQGVVGHERMLRGFKCYCYIDHKNNIFSDAQLDNRRRSKKMSNWALELQCFDIVRVWIRGEANILADAPSRAPWESALARHLPIPDMPVRDLVRKMYQEPGALEDLVSARCEVMLGSRIEWEPLAGEEPPGMVIVSDRPTLEGVGKDGYTTPDFGVEAGRLARELGCGSVAYFPGPLWPVFPCFSLSAPVREKVRVGVEVLRPVPRDPKHLPIAFEEVRDDRGHNFVVRWDGPVEFTDGESRRSLWFNVGALGEAEARRQAWSYFDEMYVARAQVVGPPAPTEDEPLAHWVSRMTVGGVTTADR